MESAISKDLIFAHFARKTSPLQRQSIEHWLQQQTNEEQYYGWLEEWENTHLQYVSRTDAALQRYSRFLADNPHATEAASASVTSLMPLPGRRNGSSWLVAASVLLLLGVTSWFFRDVIQYQTYRTDYGEIQSVQLADGSQVTLNANTSLRVPRWGFGERSREVVLLGEASFAVRHLPNHQKFVVRTSNQLDVVVLGTEFTVYARQRGAKVVLKKGKVQVNYMEQLTNNPAAPPRQPKHLLMKPGDLVILDLHNHLTHKTVKQPQLYSAWQEKRFVFDETTLAEVAEMLRESYGLEVAISDPDLADRVLMGSFRADNVDQLLQTISELLNISIVRQGNRVQLTAR